MLFQDREPWSFADREKVLWPEVVRVINHLFERQTERALTAEQLGYLAERLMGKFVTCRLFLFKQLQSMGHAVDRWPVATWLDFWVT